MMILYEVNLKIDASIYQDYVNWLIPHVEEMLTFKGFQKAKFQEVLEPKPEDNNTHQLTVTYQIDSLADMQAYLDKGAAKMRQDGLSRFGDKFSATRRILKMNQEFIHKK